MTQSGAAVGVERHRPVVGLQRLVREAGVDQQVGAVAVGLGEIGVEGDGRVEGLGGLDQRAELLAGLADQVVQAGLWLAERQRALGEVDALLVLALLAGDHGDVIERLGVAGVGAQDLGVVVHRLGQLSLAMVEKALLQELFGRGSGFGHGRCLSSLLGLSQA